MSEIITDLAWYPPEFPRLGRLPSQVALVGANCRKQDSEEQKYHDELCVAANRLVAPPCCKTLHISLFFDGCGNNPTMNFMGLKIIQPCPFAVGRVQ